MKTIRFEKKENVGQLFFCRPQSRNSMNAEMIAEVTDFFEKEKGLRLLVLSGEGDFFSAGADLNWMKSFAGASFEQNKEDAQKLRKMFLSMQAASFPIISVAKGAVFGGALGFLALSDWVIADKNTLFAFSEVKLGIAPAVVSEFILNRCALGSVYPWMVSGRKFDSEIAQRMGLIQEFASLQDLDDRLLGVKQEFLSCGPQAFRETKQLLMNFAEKKNETCDLIARLRVSPEGQSGLSAFLNKTKPPWVQK